MRYLSFLKAGNAVSSSSLLPYAASSPFLFSKLIQHIHWSSTEVFFLLLELFFWRLSEINYPSSLLGLQRTWGEEKGKGGCSSCNMFNWLSCLVKHQLVTEVEFSFYIVLTWNHLFGFVIMLNEHILTL